MTKLKKIILSVVFLLLLCVSFIAGGFLGFSEGYAYRVYQGSIGDSFSTYRALEMINAGDITGAKKHLEMELDTEIIEHWSGLHSRPYIFNMLVENEVATNQLMSKVAAYRKTRPPITEDAKVKAAIESVVKKYSE